MRRLILLLPVLGGCTVGPNYMAPAPGTPDRWVDGRPAGLAVSATAPWWREFRDPVLDALVERALAGNVDVQRARAAVDEARAALTQAQAGGKPQLNAAASYTQQSGGIGATKPTYHQTSSAGFDASWELDLWGKHARGTEAANANVGAAEANVDDARLTLLGDVARIYMRIRGTQQMVNLMQEAAGPRRKAVSDTQDRTRLGAGTGLEVVQAQAALLESQTGVANAQAEIRVGLNALAILCGVAPSELPALDGAAGKVPQAPLPALGIPADLVRRRPDVRSAERAYAQAVAEIGAAEAEKYPTISISGSLTLNPASIATIMAQPLLAIAPSISLPIFDGGKADAAVAGAKARAEQARLSFRSAVLRALQEVEDAMARVQGEAKTYDVQRKLLAATEEQLQSARIGAFKGDGAYAPIIETLRLVDAAKMAVSQANVNRAVQTVALYKALGGGWAAR